MLNKITVALDCSRIYSLPMTIISWLVVFTYATFESGNIWYGILALAGISFAHLGTNVLDDYIDYKFLIKQVNFDKHEYLKNAQKTKCGHLISGMMTEKDIIILAAIYFALAGIIGFFFFIQCGMPVLYFALGGGIIGILYSFLSRIRLSEIAVGLAYGPLLFGGVFYVMTKTIPAEVLWLSIPTMFVTIILLYIHTIMDFDYDLKEGHLTVANYFDSQLDALIILKIFIIISYSSLVLLCILDILDWQAFFVFLTIPLSIDLYKSMEEFSIDPSSVPEKKWYHFPMENMRQVIRLNAKPFMIRMYQSRNLMIYFGLILALAIILENL